MSSEGFGDEKSKLKNKSRINIGQQTKNQLQQVDNMKQKFQSEISKKNHSQSLKKLLDKKKQNRENITRQKQDITNSLRDITNEDKKIRIGQMANQAHQNLKNEITDVEMFNDFFKKTPPYTKNLVKKDNLEKVMKKVEKNFGAKKPEETNQTKTQPKKSKENEQKTNQSRKQETHKLKKNKRRS